MLALIGHDNGKKARTYISVQVAGKYTGYSLQYLRRLLRNGKLGGIKIGQLWLVDKGALDACLNQVRKTTDRRFGPK
jgi:excisionase family DNA binding protein